MSKGLASTQAGAFPATSWTFISLLRQTENANTAEMLGEFLRSYHQPLDNFLRLGLFVRNQDDREDLLQGFVTDQVLVRSILKSARKEKGKLRTFVLTCLKNYVINQRSLKSNREWDSLERCTLESDAKHHVNDDQKMLFDVFWARDVTRKAIDVMEEDCKQVSKKKLWHVFEMRVLTPSQSGQEPPSFKVVAQALAIKEGQARNLLFSARQQFRLHLKQVVSEYTADDRETETEIRLLNDSLAASSHLLDRISF